jgi:hypothetical protein
MSTLAAEFVMKFRDQVSPGLKSLNSEFDAQKQKLREIRQEERLRSNESKQQLNEQKTALREINYLKAQKSLENIERIHATKPSKWSSNALGNARERELKAELSLNSARERGLQLSNQAKIQSEQSNLIQGKGINSLVTSMFEGVTAASLLASAITGGVGVALQTVTALAQTFGEVFKKQFNVAVEAENQLISGATVNAREFGLSRKDAKQFTADTQKKVEILGRDLPIESNQINEALSIFMNAGGAKLTGGDKKVFNDQILGSSQNAGLITKSTLLRQQLGTQITDPQYTNAIGVLANDSTKLGDVKKLEFFQKSGLYDQLKGSGFDDAKGANRIKILNKALDNLLPPEAIAEMQDSAQGLFGQLKDTLFGNRTGIFGFMKDVSVLEGDQTVFNESKRTLTMLFGSGGVLDNMGNILGVDGDTIMSSVYRSLQYFNDELQRLNEVLKLFRKPDDVVAARKEASNKFDERKDSIDEKNKNDTLRNIIEAVPFIKFGKELSTALMKDFAVGEAERKARLSAKFSGTYLTASMGLSEAFKTESRNMPSGASPVIANTAEDILPPGKLTRLIKNAYSSGNASQQSKMINIQPGAIAIYQQAGQSSEELTDMMLDKLTSLFDERNKVSYDFG